MREIEIHPLPPKENRTLPSMARSRLLETLMEKDISQSLLVLRGPNFGCETKRTWNKSFSTSFLNSHPSELFFSQSPGFPTRESLRNSFKFTRRVVLHQRSQKDYGDGPVAWPREQFAEQQMSGDLQMTDTNLHGAFTCIRMYLHICVYNT